MYKAFVVDYRPKAGKMAEELEQKANELPLVAGKSFRFLSPIVPRPLSLPKA